MISREQEESVDVRINLRISSMEAGAKVDSSGDAVGKRTSLTEPSVSLTSLLNRVEDDKMMLMMKMMLEMKLIHCNDT